MFKRSFALSSSGLVGALLAAAGISSDSFAGADVLKPTTQYGPGRKTHKRLSDGTPGTAKLRVTRQQERAEGRASIKAMESHHKRRARDDAGKALSQRSGERELREVSRRDARMTVHQLIERRGAGQFQRGRFL